MTLQHIPEGYHLEMQLPTIQAMMTGITGINFAEVSETEYEAAIHFEGISFYDVIRISKKQVESVGTPIALALLCLYTLQSKEGGTDPVLLAATNKALDSRQL